MKQNRKTYNFFQKASAVFLMLTLLWLTVSTPFIIGSQQERDKQEESTSVNLPVNSPEDDSGDSSGNNVEEKAPSTSLSEEFLHEHQSAHYWFSIISNSYKSENADVYIAFHGELHAPPPNRA